MENTLPNDAASLERRIQSLRKGLLNAWEELTLLYKLGAQATRLTDEEEITSVAVREAMTVMNANCGWAALWDGKALRVPDGSRIGVSTGAAENLNSAILAPMLWNDERRLLLHSVSEEAGLRGQEVPARLLVAAIANGGVLGGFLCLGRSADRKIFTTVDHKLLIAVATMTAMEIENVRLHRTELEKQRLAHELEMARQIQIWLMPQEHCATDYLDAAGFSEPCFEMGGDVYDLFHLTDDTCMLVVADVTGKGAPASLEAALIQGIVHGCSRHSMNLSVLMSTLNRCVRSRAVQGFYPSSVLCTIDRKGLLTYTNGGHPFPLLVQTNGRVTELKEGGLLLGFLEDVEYPQETMQLQKGDLLILYTDGVTDAENCQGETFGLPRLMDWASRQAGRSPSEVKHSLMAAINQFCQGCRQADDLTALIVRCTTGSRG